MIVIPDMSYEALFYSVKSWACQNGHPFDDLACMRIADGAYGAITVQRMNADVQKSEKIALQSLTQAYCEVLKPTDEQHALIVERFKVLVAEKEGLKK